MKIVGLIIAIVALAIIIFNAKTRCKSKSQKPIGSEEYIKKNNK